MMNRAHRILRVIGLSVCLVLVLFESGNVYAQDVRPVPTARPIGPVGSEIQTPVVQNSTGQFDPNQFLSQVDIANQELGALLLPALIAFIVLHLYIALMLTIIAGKTATPGAWMAWFPLLNVFLMCRIGRKPAWWFLLLLIPFVNVIVIVLIWAGIAHARGKGGWVGLMMIVPIANFFIPAYLAMGRSTIAARAPSDSANPVETQTPFQGPRTCRTCGSILAPDENFCGECGTPSQTTSVPDQGLQPAAQGSGIGKGCLVVILLGLIAAGGWYLKDRWLPGRQFGPIKFPPKVSAPPSAGSSAPVDPPETASADDSAVIPGIEIKPPDGGRSPAIVTRGDLPAGLEVTTRDGSVPPGTAPPGTAPKVRFLTPVQCDFSDSFERPDADQCSLGLADNSLGGTQVHRYIPVFPHPTLGNMRPIGGIIKDGSLMNNGQDFGGIQFCRSDNPCMSPARGENIGQDITIEVDLLVPAQGALVTSAGPYFRSRAAAYGDGIIGGASAGYWVQLCSTGQVKVTQLNPYGLIAETTQPAAFQDQDYHTLSMSASGSSLEVALDGRILTFSQNGRSGTTVSIPGTGGSNDGTAGLAFAAETNRGQAGGQRARNLAVGKHVSLSQH